MAGSSIMDNLFQQTLEDLIKGFRLKLIGESALVSKSMEDIHREIKSTDPHTKSTALQKLSYLSGIYGVDMSWAAFHVIEVMSSSRFAHKRVGYFAASQSFHEGTSVLLLITNQLRKDLSSTNEFEVSLALECLSTIGTVDLARDLTPDVFTLLSTSKAFVRKKAIGAILRVFEKYPDAVRVCFKRLVENLESSDPKILNAVVGVFCQLSLKDPRSYLPLAPEFYRILNDSKNNWVLIKTLKIFAKLAPLEPRLAKKIVEPICEHIRRTEAKSLMFECVRTVVTSLGDYESAVKLAVTKIREFLVDEDPNLRYLGLQALSIVAPQHLWAVLENKEVVIKSLSDEDPNVKLESLRLVMAMMSETNVEEITQVLVNYALKSDAEFCNEILDFILSACSRNVYEIIIDFDWYVSFLGEVSRIPNCQRGEEIGNQLIDIGMRVKDARLELVRVGHDLLIDPALLGNMHLHRILCAAAWVVGEYVEVAGNPFELMDALLQPRTNLLPPSIRAVYIHSAFKVLIFCLDCFLLQNEETPDVATSEGSNYYKLDDSFYPQKTAGSSEDLAVGSNADRIDACGQKSTDISMEKKIFTYESICNMLNLIESVFGPLTENQDIEVLERARNVLSFVQLIKAKIPDSSVHNVDKNDALVSAMIKLMLEAFSKELGPVSRSAQNKVSVPDGLVLKENLDDLETIYNRDIELLSSSSFCIGGPHFGHTSDASSSSLLSKEELGKSNESMSLLEHRKRHGLYYLSSEKNEIVSDDYPPADDPKIENYVNDEADSLAKLTAQSLVLKKRPSQMKTRPVVVKLDEGDVAPAAVKRPEPKDESLSGAIRDVLLGSGTGPSWSQSNPSDKSSDKKKGKKKLSTNLPSEMKEGLGDGDGDKPDLENPNARSKHRSHKKERRHKSQGKIVEEGEEHEQKEKKKSSRRHGSKSNNLPLTHLLRFLFFVIGLSLGVTISVYFKTFLFSFSLQGGGLVFHNSSSPRPPPSLPPPPAWIQPSPNGSAASYSFVASYDDPRKVGRGRYNPKMGPTITLSDWRKGSQWFELNREMAIQVVSDTKYYVVFTSLE
ncbi:AP-3 complex subunit delta [Senna tora]|uniref:AP-3 complex subunit delta n=1 Tax=Senna tora TaxID=362788 RepID=A0A834WEP1_9FABA|nr:AP-3 complex subunit delta [Senna tora]